MLRSSALLYLCSSLLVSALKPVPVRDIGERIVNGEAAKEGQIPWQVAILGSSIVYPSYLCGGALIGDEWVLTAGHCVDGATSATIYSGTISITSPNRTVSQAANFTLHDDFDATTLHNDIGLIRLRVPIVLNDRVKPITLAQEPLQADTDVTVSGWGQRSDTDTAAYSPVLNYATLTTIDNAVCESIFGSEVVRPGLVCTQSDGSALKSPCLGDSGGPVVVGFDTDPVLVALFSFVNQIGCELPYPAGNTRIAYYRDWIKEKTGI